ncbi:MAG: hypothetical protein ORO03_03090 [Alphaproteobacteria bacterium]|nr:hypothetical protein [Alphaproteobacteria bacterium]
MDIHHKIIGYSKRIYNGLTHFILVFIDAYRNEKKHISQSERDLNKLEIEFLPAALEISSTPVSIARRALAWSI